MTLEFGVFDHLDRNDLALQDFYEQRLAIIEAFDRACFFAYHGWEHHFAPLGMAPSPSVFLAAVAQRTKRLRFGTFVYALPNHHPLRVLEEICMLDHMSGGRLEIGFGRGSVPYEIAFYGENAEERQQIYAERLELILKAFTVSRLTWKGRYDLFEMNGPLPASPLRAESFDALIRQGQAIAGSAETVRAFLGAQMKECGANYIGGQFCFGDLRFAERLRSVELFAAEVMPPLRAAAAQ